MKTFVDANIWMYAAGREHPHKLPSYRWVEKIARTEDPDSYFVNTEVLQEILHRYQALNLAHLGRTLFDTVLALPLTVWSVDTKDMLLARELLEVDQQISVRDAVHVATLKNRGVTRILSYDRGLDSVSKRMGIERIEPERK